MRFTYLLIKVFNIRGSLLKENKASLPFITYELGKIVGGGHTNIEEVLYSGCPFLLQSEGTNSKVLVL